MPMQVRRCGTTIEEGSEEVEMIYARTTAAFFTSRATIMGVRGLFLPGFYGVRSDNGALKHLSVIPW